MIKELQKTFEYFPKQKDEEDRSLMVTNYNDAYQLNMIVYIRGVKHRYAEHISKFEAMSWNEYIEHNEEVILRRICRNFSDYLGDDPQ